jgi:hypothetical protein
MADALAKAGSIEETATISNKAVIFYCAIAKARVTRCTHARSPLSLRRITN